MRSLVEDWTLPLPGDAQLALHWNNERVTIPGIAAPPGSQEAVDAITTASRPIAGNAYQDYVKTRNEVQGELARGKRDGELLRLERVRLPRAAARARYVNRDFDDQQLNLSVGTSYGWDDIKPLRQRGTRRPPRTPRARCTGTPSRPKSSRPPRCCAGGSSTTS